MTLWVETTDPVELRPNATEAELQIVIRAAYRQVFGNQHILDSQSLTSAESLLRDGDISVKGFVRILARSELYRSLFFDNSSPYRFVELNCKHFLGRAPIDREEVAAHVLTYNTQGYDAEIDSYIDSDEYATNFGEDTVPYVRGNRTQVGIKNAGYNRTFSLERGYASNDSGRDAALIGDLGANLPTKIKAPASAIGSGTCGNTGKSFLIRIATSQSPARLNRYSSLEYVVDYSQMSQTIRGIQKSGGKILDIAETSQYR